MDNIDTFLQYQAGHLVAKTASIHQGCHHAGITWWPCHQHKSPTDVISGPNASKSNNCMNSRSAYVCVSCSNSGNLFHPGKHQLIIFRILWTHMGMALKTIWIVPRLSARLERGDYVKGHDPEVSKAPNDMTWMVYMSLCLDQRSHGKAERSGIETARPAIAFTLGFNLTLSTLGTGWRELQISWIVNQQLEARKETKQSQALRRRYTELVVVWIEFGSA